MLEVLSDEEFVVRPPKDPRFRGTKGSRCSLVSSAEMHAEAL